MALKLGADYSNNKPFWTDGRIQEAFMHYTGMEIRDADGNVIKPAGKTPTYPLLDSLGPEGRSLAYAVERKGGIYAWRKKTGKNDSSRAENGSLAEKEAYMKAMEPLVQADTLVNPETGHVVKKQPGKVPTVQQFRKSGNYDLLYATTHHHGGINGARAYYGEERVERKQPKWKSRAIARAALGELAEMKFYIGEQIVKEAGRLPTHEQLKRLGTLRAVMPGKGNVDVEKYRGLEAGLRLYHHGVTTIAAELNRRPAKRKDNYWTTDALKSGIFNYLAENGGIGSSGRFTPKAAELLADKALRGAGRGDLRKAISSHGGYYKVRGMMGIHEIPIITENKNPYPAYADDAMAALLEVIKNPAAAIILSYCFDGRFETVEDAYANMTGTKLSKRAFADSCRVLIDNWMVRKVRIGRETFIELTPFGEYYGQPAAFNSLVYVADTSMPVSALIGKRHKEPLVVARAIESLSGVPRAFDAPFTERDMGSGMRQLRKLKQLDYGGLSGEAVYLAESLLVPMEEAASDLTSLAEFRSRFDKAAIRGDNYAIMAVQALKTA